MVDIRSFVPSSRALHRHSPRVESVSPEGRLRADACAPWTGSREHPCVVDGVEARGRHAGGKSAQ